MKSKGFMKKDKNNEKIFYKAVDENLCGRNGFQYKVGGIYTPVKENLDDDWLWLYFSDKISTTTQYGGAHPRIFEVNPLGKVKTWNIKGNVVMPRGTDIGYHYCTNKLEIIRELPKEEVFEILSEENCPPWYALMLNPPFEMLKKWKNMRKGRTEFQLHVLKREDLTIEEKEQLLSKHFFKTLLS